MMRATAAALLLACILFPSGAMGLDATPLTPSALEGRLGADGWFASRPLIAFSADGSWMVLGDRFGRSVSAFDLDGRELWTIPIPTGREVLALALDPAGRLFVVPSGARTLCIYDRPAIAPREVDRPPAGEDGREIHLVRAGSEIVLGSIGSRILYRIDAQGAVAGIDTMPSEAATLRAYGPRGAIWTYRNGDRRIRGGEGGKRSIALEAPLTSRAAIAVSDEGIIWVYDGSGGRLAGYTSNGFRHREYSVAPRIDDPAGMWVDPTGAFWIADRPRGRFVRYAP